MKKLLICLFCLMLTCGFISPIAAEGNGDASGDASGDATGESALEVDSSIGANQSSTVALTQEILFNNLPDAAKDELSGGVLGIKATIESVNSADVNGEVVSTIENTVSAELKNNIAGYLNITQIVLFNGIVTSYNYSTLPVQRLTVPLPDSLPVVETGFKREYRIIRSHYENGKYAVDVLPASLNKDGKLDFSSDKFSTYAISYEDKAVTVQDTKPSESTGNSQSEPDYVIVNTCVK